MGYRVFDYVDSNTSYSYANSGSTVIDGFEQVTELVSLLPCVGGAVVCV